MTALLLLTTTVLMILYGGADRVAAWLLPSIPLQMAQLLVLGGLIILTALLLTPTRMIAQSLIIGSTRIVLQLMLATAVTIMSALRAIWATLRHAICHLRRSE